MNKFIRFTPVVILMLFFLAGCDSKKEQVSAPINLDYLPGDINNNGIAYEVADAVLYSNYFVYGDNVFFVDFKKQIAASDVNRDGNSLTISDLVYLVRIVVGDALPITRVFDTLTVRYEHEQNGVVSIKDGVRIGAAYIIVQGESTPLLYADNMEMFYAYNGEDTRVLVWSRDAKSFTGDFLNLHGQIETIEMATFEGRPIVIKEELDPSEFYLYQNEPNPFTRETEIRFALAYNNMEATLIILDWTGSVVFQLTQIYNAGVSTLLWEAKDQDGRRLPGGTYTCKLIYNGQEQSIEMRLLGPR